MKSQYTFEISKPFVLDESGLKKIVDLLTARIGPVEVRGHCADQVVRSFATLQELYAYENRKPTQIKRLRLAAHSDDHSTRAEIDFSGSLWRGISLDFQGRDDVVSRLRSSVLDVVEDLQPWYAFIRRISFTGLIVIGAAALFLIGAFLIATNMVHVPPTTNPIQPANVRASAAGVIIGIGLLGIGIVLDSLRDRLFPRAVFLIGAGKARYAHLEKVQWGVIISFVVSIAACGAFVALQHFLGF